MRITSKGQVTIPLEIREQAGLLPGTEIDFQLDKEGIVRLVKPECQPANTALKQAIENLRGRSTEPLSTDELMALTRS